MKTNEICDHGWIPAANGQVPRRLRRTVIKEELVAVTGDPMSAAVLNYFIECTEYARRIDEHIEAEKSLLNEWAREDFCIEPTEGWVRRGAKDLARDLMIGSDRTTRSYAATCIRLGLIEERRNPHNKFDGTKQYRVDFDELRRQLRVKGFVLGDYAAG
ncbi:MAG: hypothetical protein QGH15_18385 [Kiritimatiellia bacterium]|nr:hypothetical protein [Kiritimatiellia bacterium]